MTVFNALTATGKVFKAQEFDFPFINLGGLDSHEDHLGMTNSMLFSLKSDGEAHV